MLNLQKKLREQQGGSSPSLASPFSSSPKDGSIGRISIRDKLLVQEVQELSCSLPSTCHVDYPSSSHLHNFTLTVRPDDGMYLGGIFKFQIDVPPEYNMEPPAVRCLTRLWHPNITEEGSVCLSLLRPTSVDGLGKKPYRNYVKKFFATKKQLFFLPDTNRSAGKGTFPTVPGWAPTRHLKDVVYGLNSLFFDLIDFDDPLNIEAAEHYRKNPEEYKIKVKDYIRRFCTVK